MGKASAAARMLERAPAPNWRKLRGEWELTRKDRLRGHLANLRAALPEREAALIGWDAILSYVNDTLRLRTRWGTPVSSNVALRWVRELGMPLARGCRAFRGSKGWAPHSQVWSTTFLLASWAASLFSTGERGPFAVAQEGELRNPQPPEAAGIMQEPPRSAPRYARLATARTRPDDRRGEAAGGERG